MSKVKNIVIVCIVIIFYGAVALALVSSPDVEDYIAAHHWNRGYIVKSGDTLWQIASKLNSSYDIRLVIAAIEKANGIDSFLKVNQKIKLPDIK